MELKTSPNKDAFMLVERKILLKNLLNIISKIPLNSGADSFKISLVIPFLNLSMARVAGLQEVLIKKSIKQSNNDKSTHFHHSVFFIKFPRLEFDGNEPSVLELNDVCC